MTTTNPLAKFFRQPAIYMRLPSLGKHWLQNSVEIPENGELAVFPMTAIDEITYRTPDALFNGSAVVSVIQSCVPNIKNAWHTPSCDINTVLVAIRIASYGHNMDIDSICPNCNNENNRAADLRSVLDSIRIADYSKGLEFGDLAIRFKPLSYKEMNDVNMKSFENQKILQQLNDESINEQEKFKIITQGYKQITDGTIDALSKSIASIKTPDALVTETEFIREFLVNCDRQIFEKIKAQSIKLKDTSDFKPFDIKCEKCNHEYQQPFTLDMTSFFGSAS